MIILLNSEMLILINDTDMVSGLTAIEAWMLSCILFVFGALVGNRLTVPVISISHLICSEYALILMRKQSEAIKPQRNHVKVRESLWVIL